MKKPIVWLFLLLYFRAVSAMAGAYEDIKKEYSADSYLVGIGEVVSSGNQHSDRMMAETLARLEIAKQIRVRMQEESIDIMCEGEGKTAFAGMEECRNQLTTVIEATVDELLRDSQIVKSGEDKDRGVYYAVAVLPKHFPPFRKGGKGGFEQQESVIPAEAGIQNAGRGLDSHFRGNDDLTPAPPLPENIPSPSGRGKACPERNRRSEGGPTVEEVTVVTAEGKIVLGDDTTPARARAIAMNNARRTALEEAVGVNLHGSSVIYNSDLVTDLVITATKGLIVKQNVLEDRCYTEEDRIYCLVRIEAHVRPLPQPDSKKVNILKASIQRPDKDTPANSPVFQDGDEIQIKAAASDNVFINIFSIDQYGNVIKLYPNNYIKTEIIPSGREFVFPDDSLRNQGLQAPNSGDTLHNSVYPEV